MKQTRLAPIAFLLCLAQAGGCKPDDQKTGSVSKADVAEARSKMPDEVRLHVDSGNAYYRRQDYERALAHYRAAARIDEKQSAPWFGIYMAQLAMGNVAGADSALKRAQKLAPGASLIHPNASSQPRKTK